MDSIGFTNSIKSIESLLAGIRKEINLSKSELDNGIFTSLENHLSSLEQHYKQLLRLSKSKNTIAELLDVKSILESKFQNLKAQIENTNDFIWSVDNDIYVLTANTSFTNSFKNAFGVVLKEGMSILVCLPEPLKSIWKERYHKALSGEQFSIIDRFDFEGIPQYSETTFNPIYAGNSIVGVACFSRDISEQKNAEVALKESEHRLKTLVDNLPSTTYRCAYDNYWTMEFISDEIEELCGYTASDFIKNKIRSFASIIHSEDQKKVINAVNKAVANKESYRIEYRIAHKTGTVKWVHERGRASYSVDGNVLWLDGVISDITSKKQSEILLKESEEQYRAIFNSISDVYMRTSLDGTILIVTPSVIDLLGYTPEEITGTSIIDLYKSPTSRDQFLAELTEKGFLRDYETTFPTRSGETKTIALNAKLLINDSGNPYAIEGMARDITLQKEAKKAIEERTKELDSIFENTPIILLLVDSDGKVLNINKAGTSNPAEEKSHLTKLLAGKAIKCVNNIRSNQSCEKGKTCDNCVIRQTLLKTFETKRNQNQIEGFVAIEINQQIVERYFLISTTYIEFDNHQRVLISLDDITDMREAEDELRRLSVAVNQSSATIVITDINGRIEYVNPQFEKSTGYKAIEAIGKNPRILRSDETPQEHYADMWKTIKSGKTWTGEFLNTRKDKSLYWESANITPITNRDGRITHFIAIKEDITEKKKIQEELIKSEKDLREMNTEKSRYFSILAHDLRGLVGSFHAYSDLMLSHYDEFSEQERKDQIQNLARVSSDSLSLLDNLLTWGKASQGRLKLNIVSTNLHNNIEVVKNTLNELAANKDITLINSVDKKWNINSDENILQTIVRNLVNNSIKFTNTNGSITISAKETNANSLEISVTDTGIGMNEATKAKLFRIGEKVVRQGTNDESGTGLGLIICKEMAQKLGGTLNVESEEGKGSRFYFSLPL